MKKTYRNQLPKNMEVENTSVRVENGEIIVEVECKEKFQPKDGDFLAIDDYVFIYNGKQTEYSYGAYIGTLESGKIINSVTEDLWSKKDGCRFATPKEKAAFLERLEKDYGKKWNAEKKCLEDVYVPKFGDIVRIEHPEVNSFKRNYVLSIFPNKEAPQESVNDFFDIATIDMDGYVNIDDSHASYNHNHVYIASPTERKELFDKLAEIGKIWNPETKQLEDFRWKPNDDDYYFFVDSDGNIKRTRNVSHWDFSRININNCFQTEEAAQPYADKIKSVFKNSKTE